MRTALNRRVAHASGGCIPLAYELRWIEWRTLQIVVAVLAVAAIAVETLRLSVGFRVRIHDFVVRADEENRVASYVYYWSSLAVVVTVFAPAVAVPSYGMLAIGDPISGIVGSGELRRIKRPAALAAMFTVCSLVAVAFLPLRTALAMALGATVADGVKPSLGSYVVDDNLSVPVLAALVGSVVG